MPRRPAESDTAAAAAKSLQSRPTLCDPIDGSPPGSAIPGILQERTLEWVAISFSKVIIGAWIYLWAFYFVPLIIISVFVPVPYCLDNCGFVVEPEVRQVDSSSSILLSQDRFGYSRCFVFPYKL